MNFFIQPNTQPKKKGLYVRESVSPIDFLFGGEFRDPRNIH